jgi:hypothetical protein
VERGRDVPFYLSDPEHPALTTFGQWGVVCLIPKVPLSPGSRYEVKVDATWNGKPGTWRWSFTTVALRPVDAHDEAAVTRAINVASTLKGTVLNGGMMEDGDSAFLQIGLRATRRYKMVVVMIPREVSAATPRPSWARPSRSTARRTFSRTRMSTSRSRLPASSGSFDSGQIMSSGIGSVRGPISNKRSKRTFSRDAPP